MRGCQTLTRSWMTWIMNHKTISRGIMVNNFMRSGHKSCLFRCKHWFLDLCCSDSEQHQQKPRIIDFGHSPNSEGYKVQNIVKNQKYSVISLIPHVLYQQFRYFFNLFFLVITLSQFIA